ncbi:1-acyl-sn-glycerol-3-phosphate acyltransferase [Virgisporangium aliadipatigenens]|uniref:1-acyl-sn-glycerol-3-phosphate acyltransferase n=1 Tax=Virgisporangium aliadipatigenens TaxID=741659 RepID=A0A8J4DVJ5_9ACTN|nr:lysophospholipid acyltransferase family protein [Virgisporangium aliadipatigenens]GIJ50187.1 1-acyl-sn-glycerol-3-phosphate acyltransferase [Virgisporangium aliadipatigenens]
MWQPTSGCGGDCLPAEGAVPRASRWTVAGRLLAVVAVVLAGAVTLPFVPAPRAAAAVRRFSRALLAALGVRHTVRGRLPGRGAFVVSNHVSWMDVLVLYAHLPARLVAKTEVGEWPVFGRLSHVAGTIFINRSRPRTLPDTVAEVREALAAGDVVAAFPEGTTYCGRTGGRFRPALFQAVVATGTPVMPLRLRYTLADGTATTVAAFIADHTLLRSFRRVVVARGLTVTAQALPALYPTGESTRRTLASASGSSVGRTSVSRRRVNAPPVPPASRALTDTAEVGHVS